MRISTTRWTWPDISPFFHSTPRERLNRRRRIGAIVHTDVWPSHMTVMEAVLVAQFYHFDQPRDQQKDREQNENRDGDRSE